MLGKQGWWEGDASRKHRFEEIAVTSQAEEPLPAACLVVVTKRETVCVMQGSLPPPPEVQPCSRCAPFAGWQGSACLTRLKGHWPCFQTKHGHPRQHPWW